MTRYVAFLRGVSPMNARMPDLKRAFEAAGFDDVKTLLSSGNVAFSARTAAPATLERRAEQAMQATLGRSFTPIVRRSAFLQGLIESDPFAGFALAPSAKRVVTFLRRPAATRPALPIAIDGASILAMTDNEVFTAYVASDKGPVFMTLLERTFGTDITTRTLDTVKRCAQA